MSREQHLAELERLLAQIRGEDTEQDASPRASVGLPTAYEYGTGTQDRMPALRPPEMPLVTVPPAAVLDQYGRVIGYSQVSNLTPPAPAPKIDVLTQRMVGGGVGIGAASAGLALFLHVAETAVIPLALIAAITVSLAYLRHSMKSGGSGGANVNVTVKVNQRNG